MNSTLFLQMFGLDPDQFEEGIAGPEETDSGWAMSLVQRSDRRTCPLCHKADAVVVKDRCLRRLRHAMPDGRPGVILIERPRMLCRRCSRSFYPALKGVSGKSRMTATEALFDEGGSHGHGDLRLDREEARGVRTRGHPNVRPHVPRGINSNPNL